MVKQIIDILTDIFKLYIFETASSAIEKGLLDQMNLELSDAFLQNPQLQLVSIDDNQPKIVVDGVIDGKEFTITIVNQTFTVVLK